MKYCLDRIERVLREDHAALPRIENSLRQISETLPRVLSHIKVIAGLLLLYGSMWVFSRAVGTSVRITL